jgi:hypothetical protein
MRAAEDAQNDAMGVPERRSGVADRRVARVLALRRARGVREPCRGALPRVSLLRVGSA